MSSRYYGIFSPKTAKNRRFNYVPRFYDEDMEDLRQRVKSTQDSVNKEYDPSGFKDRIRSGFERRERAYNTHQSKEMWVSRLRLVLIIGILSYATYLLMNNNLLSFIFEAFDKNV